MTHVLGSVKSDGITGLRTKAKAIDRENLDLEGVILMTCRQTKKGDELRRVVPLNIIQWSKVRVLIPLRECCQRHSRICRFIAKTGQRQKPMTKRSLGKGLTLRSPRIWLLITEVSLVSLATNLSSRKGPCRHAPKVWKCGAQKRGEVYSLLN